MTEGFLREFDPAIFPIKLMVIIGADKDYLSGRFVNMETDQDDTSTFDDFEFRTVLVGDRMTDMQKFLVLIDDASLPMDIGYITHEAGHVGTLMCKSFNIPIGLEPGEDEFHCYIAGWTARCIKQTLDEYEKEINKNG